MDSLILHNPPFAYLDGHNNEHYVILERLKEEGKIKAYEAVSTVIPGNTTIDQLKGNLESAKKLSQQNW